MLRPLLNQTIKAYQSLLVELLLTREHRKKENQFDIYYIQ